MNIHGWLRRLGKMFLRGVIVRLPPFAHETPAAYQPSMACRMVALDNKILAR